MSQNDFNSICDAITYVIETEALEFDKWEFQVLESIKKLRHSFSSMDNRIKMF